jgi:exopolysaccharide biosynthesis protein
MLKTVKRVIAAGASALLVLGASNIAASPAQAAGDSCLSAPQLSSAATIASKTLSSGVDFKSYTFAPGVANGTFFYTKVSVAHAYLSKINLVATSSEIGKSASQLHLASQVNSIAYLNTDYFNEGNGLPYSAIIKHGTPIYAPSGTSKVVGTVPLTYSLATGFYANAQFNLSTLRFAIAGVNLADLPPNSANAYTSAFTGSRLPVSSASALIVAGKVVAIYKGWVKGKPKTGTLIVARGTVATRLLKIKAGASTNFKLPSVPASSTQIKSGSVRLTGSAATGSATLRIRAVNSDTSTFATGIRLYDKNFTTSRYTAHSNYTVVVNASGFVQARYKPGRDAAVPANGYVLQLGTDGLPFYNSASIGSKVTVNNTILATSGLRFIDASGSGAQVLVNGFNQQDCQPFHEEIRPRSAIGWNNATGEVWLVTTSSGQDLVDFGFRMGGSSIHQTFDWLRMLGATDAVTLDGGGSTTMFIQDGTGLKRQDIPDSAWLRDIIVGMALVAKD